jgi:ABC-type lipopolysaccharide export system ATPase subunit
LINDHKARELLGIVDAPYVIEAAVSWRRAVSKRSSATRMSAASYLGEEFRL